MTAVLGSLVVIVPFGKDAAQDCTTFPAYSREETIFEIAECSKEAYSLQWASAWRAAKPKLRYPRAKEALKTGGCHDDGY